MKISTIIISSGLLISHFSFSQNSEVPSTRVESKKIQAGLTLASGMLFTNFETSHVEKDGLGSFFGLGFGANISLMKNIGIYSGLEFHFERFGYKPTNVFDFNYDYNDKEILRKGDEDVPQGTMEMQSRRQNTVAVNIPIMLIFRTDMIGYFRYFGKFGLRNSILMRQRVTDTGVSSENPAVTTKLEGMRAKNDLFFMRSSAGIAAGAEWNFASSTSLSFEAGFYYGFSPVFSGFGKSDRNNSSLYVIDEGTTVYRSFKANQSVFEIKAILLF